MHLLGVTVCTSPFGACWDLSLVVGLDSKGRAGIGPEEMWLCLARQLPQGRPLQLLHAKQSLPQMRVEGQLLLTSKGDPAEFRGSVSPASLREMSPHVPVPVFRIPFLQIHTLS